MKRAVNAVATVLLLAISKTASALSSGMLAVVYIAHGNGAVYVQAFSENPR